MANAVAVVSFTSFGRIINPSTGQPGATVTISAGSSIEYSPADLDTSGLVGSSTELCLRSYSIVRVPADTGQVIESAQPIVITIPSTDEPVVPDGSENS